MPAEFVEIGVVSRAHGIRGELRVRLHNPESAVLEGTAMVRLGDSTFEIVSCRRVSGARLLGLRGVSDRTEAERLKGTVVSVERSQLPLEPEDVLLSDMVGLRAVLEDGSDWGQVVRIETGAQDRLVVSHAGVERQLPIVDSFILGVDLEAGTVLVAPPEGLPED